MSSFLNNITCINCGFTGHTSLNCNFPVTSYGIICFQIFSNEVRFLMIQRKDSLAYVDFVRGKYTLNDVAYIQSLLENMTVGEREKILTYNFNQLWKDMWGETHMNSHTSHKRNYEKSSSLFNRLRVGFNFRYQNGQVVFINIENLLSSCVSNFEETEWEFPKGRRVLYEDDFSCAKREFHEETGVPIDKLYWITPKYFEEIYTGTNKIRYRNVYYMSQYVGNQVYINKDTLGSKQKEEVRDIRWMNVTEVSEVLRDIYMERKELIQRVNNMVHKFLKKQGYKI